jgi:hypothetical protein
VLIKHDEKKLRLSGTCDRGIGLHVPGIKNSKQHHHQKLAKSREIYEEPRTKKKKKKERARSSKIHIPLKKTVFSPSPPNFLKNCSVFFVIIFPPLHYYLSIFTTPKKKSRRWHILLL